MNQEDFSDAVLVLLGHGTSADPGAAAAVIQHAAELRRRGIFAEVREAFWKQEPQLISVLASIERPRVFIVPIFISEGYFSGNVIPRALGFHVEREGEFGRTLRAEGKTLVYCRPVGVHDRMTELVLARAREVLEQAPFPEQVPPAEVTLIVVGHGTGQDVNSRKTLEHQVELLRAHSPYAAVYAVFLEEEPRIPKCYELAQTRNIVVVPFFISDGPHVCQDIPLQLGEPAHIIHQRLEIGQAPWRNPTERCGKLVWYAASVGTDARVADIILDQVHQAL